MHSANKNRFIQTIKFIYHNINQNITLDELAKHLHISTTSLKRLFLDATGKSVGQFIRRMRMEKAFQTLQQKELSILETALSVGFEDHAAFSRSFKENFGYAPTFARQKMNIVNELVCISLDEPEFLEIEEQALQVVTKQGLYFEAPPLAWKELKERLNTAELEDNFLGVFIGIGHDNPHDGKVREEQVRFSAGIAFCKHDLQIETFVIRSGNYAKFTFSGKINNLGLAYHYIYGKWSIESKININSYLPAFMAFETFPDGFDEQKIAIYVPLQSEI